MSLTAFQGLTVLDLGQYISAPMAGQNLADLGARVIKIEAPTGEQARTIGVFGEAIVEACNRGKDSIALDLTLEDDRAQLQTLIASADVLIHNFLPRTARKLGVDWDTVSELNPRLICGVASGFGRRGPNRETPGLDIMAQAEFGIMGVTGEAEGQPQRAGFAVSDVLASHSLTTGILAAILERNTTGRGILVETSLMEATVHAQAVQWAEYAMTGNSPRRKGNGQPTAAPAADVITVSDGEIVVSAYTRSKWEALCNVLERPELAVDPRFISNPQRVANRESMLDILHAAFGHLTTAQAIDLLRSAGIVCGRIRTLDEIIGDPDLIASNLLTNIDLRGEQGAQAAGLPSLPVVFDGKRSVAHGRAPAVGSAPTTNASTHSVPASAPSPVQ
ncbi:CaiB/BaiF CoA transferase family protein [Brevibacterium sp. GP-SGM9]|uniref:CaiB/BaiF CoA transferase family protein n=1 Tax=Brevibacterium sp. GP-SGM9 TaxID=3376990 RepID=UPI0039A785E1